MNGNLKFYELAARIIKREEKMKSIKIAKLGGVLANMSKSTLIARRQSLDNKNWYIVLTLDAKTNVYGIYRTRDEDSELFGHYTPDFMEAIGYFLDHFGLSVRRKRN